jgi:hypothetical protein
LGEFNLASAGLEGLSSSSPKESIPAAAMFFAATTTCDDRPFIVVYRIGLLRAIQSFMIVDAAPCVLIFL